MRFFFYTYYIPYGKYSSDLNPRGTGNNPNHSKEYYAYFSDNSPGTNHSWKKGGIILEDSLYLSLLFSPFP
jgi:hypothetical protein